MNGRELFEIYALEAALGHDTHRPYWDFLTCKNRDLWDRVAKRLEADDPLAGVEIYEVDGSRYSINSGARTGRVSYATPNLSNLPRDERLGPVTQRPSPLSAETASDDYPLSPDRMHRFRAWASKFTWDSRRGSGR